MQQQQWRTLNSGTTGYLNGQWSYAAAAGGAELKRELHTEFTRTRHMRAHAARLLDISCWQDRSHFGGTHVNIHPGI